jgi:BolA protein
MKQRIEAKIYTNLQPKFLEVKNNSHLHSNHKGHNKSCETHFAITVAADKLKCLTRIEAHRKINSFLKDEFSNGLHALEIKIKK